MEGEVPPLARVPCPPGSRFHITWGAGNTVILAPVSVDRDAAVSDSTDTLLNTVSTVRWCV